VVVGAVTTAWDAAHKVIATMGDRFLLVRLAADAAGRRAAGLQAMRNVNHEVAMREELASVVGKLLGSITANTGSLRMADDEAGNVYDLADLVTRARTAVEKDNRGEPLFAHALEMPTRLANSWSSSAAAPWRSA
jgi:hypothetical protein